MSAASQPEFSRDRAIGGNPVKIVLNGKTETVPYRKAVGLVSVGRATWYAEPEKAPGKPRKVSPSASEARSGTSGGPKPSEAEKKPDVSAPASSAEGDETGNEPSRFDT